MSAYLLELSTIMAVCTRFDPQPKGVRFFSDAEREEAYLQARPFFLEQMKILLEDGWKHTNNCTEEVYPSFTNHLQSSIHYFTITIIRSYSISITQRYAAYHGNSSSQKHLAVSWIYPRPTHGEQFLRIARYSTLVKM